MHEEVSPNILAVGASLANLRRGARSGNRQTAKGASGRTLVRPESLEGDVSHVETARHAVELLKVMKFDLVAIGNDVPDATAWQLARKVRTVWPWQKWAFVARDMDHEDEVMARSLGAVAIFEGPDCWGSVVEVAHRVRRRNPAAVVAGLSTGFSEYAPY